MIYSNHRWSFYRKYSFLLKAHSWSEIIKQKPIILTIRIQTSLFKVRKSSLVEDIYVSNSPQNQCCYWFETPSSCLSLIMLFLLESVRNNKLNYILCYLKIRKDQIQKYIPYYEYKRRTLFVKQTRPYNHSILTHNLLRIPTR